MGVQSYDMEITLKSLPEKIFKALFVVGDTLVPMVLPRLVEKVTRQGNGSPETFNLVTFGIELDNKYAKVKINNMDDKNFTYECTITEGSAMNDRVSSISFNVQIVAFNEGSKFQDTTTYVTKGTYIVPPTDINLGKEKIKEIVEAVDNYISENPNYC